MKLKELKPKYEKLEIYQDKDGFSLLEIPARMKYDFAVTTYGEKEVLYLEDQDRTQTTKIILGR